MRAITIYAQAQMHIHMRRNIYTAHHIVLCYIIIFQIRKNKPLKWKLRSQVLTVHLPLISYSLLGQLYPLLLHVSMYKMGTDLLSN